MYRQVKLLAWSGACVAGGFGSAAGLDYLLYQQAEADYHTRTAEEAMHLRAEVRKLTHDRLTLACDLECARDRTARLESEAARLRRQLVEQMGFFVPAAAAGREVDPADRIPPQNVPTRPGQ